MSPVVPTGTESDCLFCRIVAGDIPSRQVYADETAVAFLDVSPWQRGHTLVVAGALVTHRRTDPPPPAPRRPPPTDPSPPRPPV